MLQRNTQWLHLILLIGTLLIFINTLIVASNNSPLIVKSSVVNSIEQLTKPGNSLWVRISFGFKETSEGITALIFVAIACLNFILALLYFSSPKRFSLLILIIMLSIITLLVGGGFYIGTVLSVISASMLLSQNRRGELFVMKFLRALKLDSRIFSIQEDHVDSRHAIYTILLIGFLSGLGCKLYFSQVNMIKQSPDVAIKILLLGSLAWDNSIIYSAVTNIGILFLKWIFLSVMLYIIGKIAGYETRFDSLASRIAFSYAPISLQVILPIFLFNEPWLSFNWPMIIFFTTNALMIAGILMTLKNAYNTSIRKASAILMLGGGIYWIAVYEIFVPAIQILEPEMQLPGIFFVMRPTHLVLSLFSIAIVLSVLFGAFSKE